MANNKDRTFEIVLLFVSALSVVLIALLGPLDPWIDILALAVFIYAAYWALAIRKALGNPLFRNQALGMGLLSIAWGLTLLAALASGGSPEFSPGNLLGISPIFGSALTFYWVDASMLASRRIDPLNRNSLHWAGLRPFFWTLLILGIGLGVPNLLFTGFSSIIFSGTFSIPRLVLALAFIFEFSFSLIGPFVMGIILLPIVARRTKDRILQSHFKWFGAFMLCFVLIYVAIGNFTSFTFLPAVGAGYSLYRSARSLVPLNRLSLSD